MAGFSLVRASEDAVRGRKGKITFDNVFTDLNGITATRIYNEKAKILNCSSLPRNVESSSFSFCVQGARFG